MTSLSPFMPPGPPFDPQGLAQSALQLTNLASQTATMNQQVTSTILQQIAQTQSYTNQQLSAISNRVDTILTTCEGDIAAIAQLLEQLSLQEIAIQATDVPPVEAEATSEATDAIAAGQPELVPTIYQSAALVIARLYADAVFEVARALRPHISNLESLTQELTALSGGMSGPFANAPAALDALLAGSAIAPGGPAALSTMDAFKAPPVGVDTPPFTQDEFAAAGLVPHPAQSSWDLYEVRFPGVPGTFMAKQVPELYLRNELAVRSIAAKVGLQNDTLPIYAAERQGKAFSVAPFAPGHDLASESPADYAAIFAQVPVETRSRMFLLSYVTGESDRNPGNFLWDGTTLRSIDYGEAFSSPTTAYDGSLGDFPSLGYQGSWGTYRDFPLSQSALQDFSSQYAQIIAEAEKYKGGSVAAEVQSRMAVIQQLQQLPNPTIGDLERLGGPDIYYDSPYLGQSHP